MKSPGSGWTSGLSILRLALSLPLALRGLEQGDQQTEDLGQDRDAFEEEQRQVRRRDDLRRRARLPPDGLSGARRESADADTGANDRQPDSDRSASESNNAHSHSS